MSKKILEIYIDDELQKIKLRRIKNKEFKNLIQNMASKMDSIVAFFDNKDFRGGLIEFVCENIDFVLSECIAPFVIVENREVLNFLDDLSTYDTIIVLKELLAYNGVSVEKIMQFLNTLKIQNTESSSVEKKLEEKSKGILIPLVN